MCLEMLSCKKSNLCKIGPNLPIKYVLCKRFDGAMRRVNRKVLDFGRSSHETGDVI